MCELVPTRQPAVSRRGVAALLSSVLPARINGDSGHNRTQQQKLGQTTQPISQPQGSHRRQLWAGIAAGLCLRRPAEPAEDCVRRTQRSENCHEQSTAAACWVASVPRRHCQFRSGRRIRSRCRIRSRRVLRSQHQLDQFRPTPPAQRMQARYSPGHVHQARLLPEHTRRIAHAVPAW